MKFECPENIIEAKENAIFLEDDNMTFYVMNIEYGELICNMTGKAEVDGEIFNHILLTAKLLKEPEALNFETLFNEEWEWYDIEVNNE